MTVTSIGRRGWSQAKSSLSTKFDGRVTVPLADVLERVTQLQGQVEELTRIITAQADVANQTTELLGRLLATSSDRLEVLEDSLAELKGSQATKAGATTPASSRSAQRLPRAKPAGKPSAPGDPS
ncbi:MAG: hypothetical protein ACLQRM_11205 [Acidimicrobiales bacterium]